MCCAYPDLRACWYGCPPSIQTFLFQGNFRQQKKWRNYTFNLYAAKFSFCIAYQFSKSLTIRKEVNCSRHTILYHMCPRHMIQNSDTRHMPHYKSRSAKEIVVASTASQETPKLFQRKYVRCRKFTNLRLCVTTQSRQSQPHFDGLRDTFYCSRQQISCILFILHLNQFPPQRDLPLKVNKFEIRIDVTPCDMSPCAMSSTAI